MAPVKMVQVKNIFKRKSVASVVIATDSIGEPPMKKSKNVYVDLQ